MGSACQMRMAIYVQLNLTKIILFVILNTWIEIVPSHFRVLKPILGFGHNGRPHITYTSCLRPISTARLYTKGWTNSESRTTGVQVVFKRRTSGLVCWSHSRSGKRAFNTWDQNIGAQCHLKTWLVLWSHCFDHIMRSEWYYVWKSCRQEPL